MSCFAVALMATWAQFGYVIAVAQVLVILIKMVALLLDHQNLWLRGLAIVNLLP